MKFEDIFQRFMTISGLSMSDGEKWSFLCFDAIETIKSMMKKDIDLSACGSRLAAAASYLAYYKYILATASETPESFSAGDLRIDNSDLIANAEKMWLESKNEISDLLCDKNFSFSSVEYKRCLDWM